MGGGGRARRSAKAKAKPRPNPYKDATDKELAEERARLLDGYADRMAYFEGLPDDLLDVRKVQADGCEAHGITPAEWREYLVARVEHIVEGAKMADVSAEQRRRLREAAKARILSLSDYEAARAAYEAARDDLEPISAFEWLRLPDETAREYAERVEAYLERLAECHGASEGEFEYFQRHLSEREPRPCLM